MKIIAFAMLGCIFAAHSQSNTEVYLLDINVEERTVANAINVSNNDGYDNQPSFSSKQTLLFTKTRNGQTDAVQYDINTQVTSWLTNTGYGSEYSPIQIPENDEIASVRLDTTGLQRLYLYNERDDASRPIHESLVIGYHAWLNATELLTFVLGDESRLVYINVKTQEEKALTTNIGRSLHKIPDSNLMSYTSINKEGIHEVYILNIAEDFQSYYVCDLPLGIQDYTWINKDVMLLGSGNSLYTYDTFVDEDWQKFASLEEFGLNGITRLDVSPDGKHLAVVVEE